MYHQQHLCLHRPNSVGVYIRKWSTHEQFARHACHPRHTEMSLCQKRFPCKSFIMRYQHLPACLPPDCAKGLLLMEIPKTDLHKAIDRIAVPTAFHGFIPSGIFCISVFRPRLLHLKTELHKVPDKTNHDNAAGTATPSVSFNSSVSPLTSVLDL